jgi:hypothetical protein
MSKRQLRNFNLLQNHNSEIKSFPGAVRILTEAPSGRVYEPCTNDRRPPPCMPQPLLGYDDTPRHSIEYWTQQLIVRHTARSNNLKDDWVRNLIMLLYLPTTLQPGNGHVDQNYVHQNSITARHFKGVDQCIK